MSDAVNHPKHYNQYVGFEVIDVCEQMGFNKGNAFKYLARAGYKPEGDIDKEIEDLKKAAFYVQREIDRLHELAFKKMERVTNEQFNKMLDAGMVDPETLKADHKKGHTEALNERCD